MDETGRQHSVVIRWRTRIRLEALGPTLQRAYPAIEAAGFEDALRAIDDVERNCRSNSDPPDPPHLIINCAAPGAGS